MEMKEKVIDHIHLFYLRMAALEWLKANPEHGSAPQVREALLATQEPQ